MPEKSDTGISQLFSQTVKAVGRLNLDFSHINTSESQPGASEFIDLMLWSPLHPLPTLYLIYTIRLFLSLLPSVPLLLSPVLPAHLFSWLDWLALFWALQLGAKEPLWRGIAFKQDEVCLSLSALGLNHRVFRVHCSTSPLCVISGLWPVEVDQFSPVYYFLPLFVPHDCCGEINQWTKLRQN